MAEVFKVYEQDRIQQRRTWSRSLTFQFLRVGEGETEVLKVLSQDGVLQRMWSRSLKFLLVEVSEVFSQVRVAHRADFFKMRMSNFKSFFRTSELSAHQMAPAGESGELTDEPGGALDGALADLQRWRRGLRRRDGWG